MCAAVKIFCLRGSPWIEAGSTEGPDSSGGESRKVAGGGEAWSLSLEQDYRLAKYIR